MQNKRVWNIRTVCIGWTVIESFWIVVYPCFMCLVSCRGKLIILLVALYSLSLFMSKFVLGMYSWMVTHWLLCKNDYFMKPIIILLPCRVLHCVYPFVMCMSCPSCYTCIQYRVFLMVIWNVASNLPFLLIYRLIEK